MLFPGRFPSAVYADAPPTTICASPDRAEYKDRLNRDLRGRFGTNSYAAEELIAELGAAFLCAGLGLTNEPRADHAAYISSWLKLLRSDKRAIFTAASKAQAAA